ncbi:Phosphate regulon transcriptional regulatory protein PhoB (SphR) [Enhygromyxa salina]|uniref:Phosphate regulon transcriptional regulatory protein PhoB (SphR) n=1 Tax=Enhygromyxa salina TaxID=215803 RepID=A0A0C2D6M9_9BACT|nr:response regulator transcription factor [Enhygromyxa salina]KIG15687.1 Phosphate regulon transcriptional regulatory protein PhoB (SphR) [Enhygromyxa salina]
MTLRGRQLERPTILVIEDDGAIREGVVDALRFEGFEVEEATTAPKGEELALRSVCSLVLLDLMLPGGDGFEVLKQIRRARPRLPVIILTARGREADRVLGLRLGADDYVVKPFSVRELLARVEAVMRRTSAQPERVHGPASLRLPEGRVDLQRRELHFDDGSLAALSEREAELLGYLAKHPARAVSRDEILSQVWHLNPARFQSRTIDMHVARLREKLRDNKSAPHIIVTVRGKGYMLGHAITAQSGLGP